MFAIQCGHLPFAEMLLQEGSNPNIEDKKKNIAIDYLNRQIEEYQKLLTNEKRRDMRHFDEKRLDELKTFEVKLKLNMQEQNSK